MLSSVILLCKSRFSYSFPIFFFKFRLTLFINSSYTFDNFFQLTLEMPAHVFFFSYFVHMPFFLCLKSIICLLTFFSYICFNLFLVHSVFVYLLERSARITGWLHSSRDHSSCHPEHLLPPSPYLYSFQSSE